MEPLVRVVSAYDFNTVTTAREPTRRKKPTTPHVLCLLCSGSEMLARRRVVKYCEVWSNIVCVLLLVLVFSLWYCMYYGYVK